MKLDLETCQCWKEGFYRLLKKNIFLLKIGVALVIITSCLSMVLGCGMKNNSTDVSITPKTHNKKNKDKKLGNVEKYEKINSYDAFYLEGKKITLPISWSEFEKNGFKTDETNSEIISVDKKYIEEKVYNSAGEKLGIVKIVNREDSDIKMEEGMVTKLTLTSNADICLYGGVSFLSTKEEVYEICGEPMYRAYEEICEGSNPSQIYFFEKEKELTIEDNAEYEYKPLDTFVWCKNKYMSVGQVYNQELGTYVKDVSYHYLQLTFDDNNNISEIVFYFDCAEEKENQKETNFIDSSNFLSDENKTEVVQENGALIFSTEYNVEEYCDDCFIVSKSDGLLYGVLDKAGNEIIPVKYDDIYFVNDEEVSKGIDTEVYIVVEYENTYQTYNNKGEKIFDFKVKRTVYELGSADDESIFFVSTDSNKIRHFYNRKGELLCTVDPLDLKSLNSIDYDKTNIDVSTEIYISKNSFIFLVGGIFLDSNEDYISNYWNLVMYDNEGNIVRQWENVSSGYRAFYNNGAEVVFITETLKEEDRELYAIDENGYIKELGYLAEQSEYVMDLQKGLTKFDDVGISNVYYLGENDDIRLYSSNETWKLVDSNGQPIYDERYFECFPVNGGYFLLNEDNMLCLISGFGKMIIPPEYIEWNGSAGYYNNLEITDDNCFVSCNSAVIVKKHQEKSEIYYYYAE